MDEWQMQSINHFDFFCFQKRSTEHLLYENKDKIKLSACERKKIWKEKEDGLMKSNRANRTSAVKMIHFVL